MHKRPVGMGGARDCNAVQLMKTSHRGSSSGKTQQEERTEGEHECVSVHIRTEGLQH